MPCLFALVDGVFLPMYIPRSNSIQPTLSDPNHEEEQRSPSRCHAQSIMSSYLYPLTFKTLRRLDRADNLGVDPRGEKRTQMDIADSRMSNARQRRSASPPTLHYTA